MDGALLGALCLFIVAKIKKDLLSLLVKFEKD
jgi:hypothetical protein